MPVRPKCDRGDERGAIVTAIATAHGGTVGLASEPGDDVIETIRGMGYRLRA